MRELTREKRQAVILMHEEIFSNVRIAHLGDCSESTVSRLKKRFKTEETVDKKPRSGRSTLSSKCLMLYCHDYAVKVDLRVCFTCKRMECVHVCHCQSQKTSKETL